MDEEIEVKRLKVNTTLLSIKHNVKFFLMIFSWKTHNISNEG